MCGGGGNSTPQKQVVTKYRDPNTAGYEVGDDGVVRDRVAASEDIQSQQNENASFGSELGASRLLPNYRPFDEVKGY